MSALTLAAELIRIDSVNPGLVPGAAGEPDRAEEGPETGARYPTKSDE